ncbi:MotA/TolQ/ExbB proton channel family protein [Nannocystaceae bacterium ST9]
MNALIELFSLLSELLLIPALVGLLGLFAASVIGLGGHAVEAIERRRDAARLAPVLVELRDAAPERRGQALGRLFADLDYHGNLACFLRVARGPAGLQAALDEVEGTIDRRLARASLGLRLGPLLGLMGTLIPMGPALLALAAGDIRDMALQLVLAFTTTVIGLAIAVIATLISAARRRWYAADLRTIAGLVERASEVGEHG